MAETILVNFQAQGLDTLSAELGQVANAQEEVIKGQTSLRTQLRANQQALAQLALAGKQNTEEYKKLRDEAGKLKDAISDAAAEISQAGSDTRGLDKALRATNVLVGGFAAVQGATALFGKESENLQKTLLKVNAAMSILAGLQQIQEELNRKDSIFTSAAAKAKLAYAAAVGTATGAMKIFRLALLATGIGALVLILGTVIANWKRLTGAIVESFPSLKKVGEFFSNFQFYMVATAKGAVALFKGLGDAFANILSPKKALKELKQIPGEMKKAFSDGFETAKKAAADKKKALEDAGKEAGASFGKGFEEEVVKAVQRTTSRVLDSTRNLRRQQNEDGISPLIAATVGTPTEAEAAVGFLERLLLQSQEKLKTLQDEAIAERKAARDKELQENLANSQRIIQIAGETNAQITSIVNGAYANQLAALEQQRDKGIITEKEYAKEVARIREKQARADKATAIIQAIINTSLAITKALPNFILAGLAAALGAAQIALIAKQPIPKSPGFKKGVIGLQGEGTTTSDSITARLSKGESVMTAEETKNYKNVLWSIRKKTFDRAFVPVDVAIKKHKPMAIPAGAYSTGRTDNTGLKLDKIYEELVYQNIYTKEGNRVLHKSNHHLQALKTAQRYGIRV